jgi:hypothetical protein
VRRAAPESNFFQHLTGFRCLERRDELDSEEAAAEGANSFEMVKTLLERFPAGAMHRDMDGMLPIDWAVQNPGHGTLEVVKMLLEHYPGKCHFLGGNILLERVTPP